MTTTADLARRTALELLELGTALEPARQVAGREYVKRGPAAYTEREELLAGLALLLALAARNRATTPVTLAELIGLNNAGIVKGWGTDAYRIELTATGVELAAAAAAERGIALPVAK